MSGDNKAIMEIPQIHLPRSSFNETFKTYGSIKMNTFIPDFKFRVAPGDTLQVSADLFFRYNSIDVPVFDQIKVSLNFFSFKDRDVFDRADKVYGARYSSRDDDKKYRYFYMVNKTMPVFSNNVHSFWFPGMTAVCSNSVGASIDVSFKDSSNNNRNINVRKFPAIFRDGLPFIQNGVVYRMPFSVTRYDHPTGASYPLTEIEGVHRFLGSAPVGGMYDRLCDVVGDDVKAINPSIIIGTYMVWDMYYRHQLYQEPFIGLDRDVDTDLFVSQEDTGTNLTPSAVTVCDFNGFIANRWDENQHSLAQFLFPCTDKKVGEFTYLTHKKNPSATAEKTMAGEHVVYKGYEEDKNYNKVYAFLNGGLPPVNAKGDYFTLATIEPQAGEPISIVTESPTGTGIDLNMNLGSIPVVGNGKTLGLTVNRNNPGDTKTYFVNPADAYTYPASLGSYQDTIGGSTTGMYNPNGSAPAVGVTTDASKSGLKTIASQVSTVFPDGIPLTTVRQLRLSEILQRFQERTNRTGRRLQELLMAHHGVSLPDDQLRQPQCLSLSGSKFDYIPNVQSSETTQQSPQGHLTANGVGHLHSNGFIKSFDSFGYVVGILSITAPRTYQEQYERHLFTFEQFDLFWPEFSGVGDQPVYNYELFNPSLASGTGKDFIKYISAYYDDSIVDANTPVLSKVGPINARNFKVFGFQERFAERRYKLNKVYDTMRSRAGEVDSVPSGLSDIDEITGDGIFPLINLKRDALPSVDQWHYALDYDNEIVFEPEEGIPYKSDVPVQGSKFITSAVPWKRASYDYVNNPVIMKGKYFVKLTASLPVISIPGLSRTY